VRGGLVAAVARATRRLSYAPPTPTGK
jgi:hypothetical protein